MILPFSTKLNGKPTYFVEKILLGIDKNLGIHHTENYLLSFNKKFMSKPPVNLSSKIHTIREDKKDRWKRGAMIDFFINTRTKDMFRFAPRIPLVSTQKIEIFHNSTTFVKDGFTIPAVYIDGYEMTVSKITELAQNDGFDTIENFFAYFNEDFTGKIIHWTDKRY